MKLLLIVFGFVAALELVLWFPVVWRRRKIAAGTLAVSIAVSTTLIAVRHPSFWVVIVTILSTYRIINLLRVVKDRVQADYLFYSYRKTSRWLMGLQLIVFASAAVRQITGVDVFALWYLASGFQLLVAISLLWFTRQHLKSTKAPSIDTDLPNSELPSLTVAIPARNETTDLEACLQTLLSCNYPKLEILVLDDCSQTKRTPDIIRAFAHEGVRFIAGDTPPAHWLAKNFAYSQLAAAANGDLLLFCGVDSRFGPDSLKRIVGTLIIKKKTMLCVVPRNILQGRLGLLPSIIQSTRYAWEFALPRRLFQRPPVLSSCWVITKESLGAAGGFASFKQSILPERHLAQRATQTADGYSFVRSDTAMGLNSNKSLGELRATATRVRYPQLHRRPELVALVSLAELWFLFGPFATLGVSLLSGRLILTGVAVLDCLILLIFFSRIVNTTYRKFLVRSIYLLPLAALYDLGLLNYSMWKYEFDKVIWKDRNVCIPIMHVTAHLPTQD